MKARNPRARPERIAWFEGSRLTRRDLADAIEHEARMLDLHVRATHDTEGIASGLATTLSADGRTVTVQPGLAYSCRGASVLLHAPASIGAPPASTPGARFDLVLVSAAPAPGCGAPALDCTGARIPVHARLRWSAADDGPGCECDVPDDAIHLGRFTRTSGGTLVGPNNEHRRTVRGLVRPHLASGVTAPGALVWQQGSADLFARVDTSAAGFTTAPVYLVSLASPLPWTGNLVAPFLSVGGATPTGFDVHVVIAAKPPALVLLFAQIGLMKELSFSWTGVESAVGCSGGPGLSALLVPGLITGVFT